MCCFLAVCFECMGRAYQVYAYRVAVVICLGVCQLRLLFRLGSAMSFGVVPRSLLARAMLHDRCAGSNGPAPPP